MSFIKNSLSEAQLTLNKFIENEQNLNKIEEAIELFVSSFKNKGRVFSCGNGGSMCDSLHFAEELTGRYRKDRAPLPATGISEAGHMTCIANDFRIAIFNKNRTLCILRISSANTYIA